MNGGGTITEATTQSNNRHDIFFPRSAKTRVHAAAYCRPYHRKQGLAESNARNAFTTVNLNLAFILNKPDQSKNLQIAGRRRIQAQGPPRTQDAASVKNRGIK